MALLHVSSHIRPQIEKAVPVGDLPILEAEGESNKAWNLMVF